MSVVVVIAKYKENVSWVENLKYNYIIYDKSKDVPNIGRESETYLKYIINHYNNLPDYVVFLQGNPFDHLLQPNIDYLNNEISNIKQKEFVERARQRLQRLKDLEKAQEQLQMIRLRTVCKVIVWS